MNTIPIEFMAWDYDNECMYDDSQIIIHEGTVFIGKIKYIHQISQDVELMQLTALRSINDEPIYNHMIVKDQYGDMYEIDMFDYKLMYALSADRKLKIVGNVFQHKHLLDNIS